jgi:hypothetical protein
VDAIFDLFQHLSLARRENDMSTGRSKGFGNRRANAAACACHKRNLTFQTARH